MSKDKQNYILIGLLVTILAVGHFVGGKEKENLSPAEKIDISENQIIPPVPSTETEIPIAYQIKNVPFTSQAPLVNWDQLHDEACEEASLTIVDYYLNNKTLTKDLAENEIQSQVAWEIGYFGSHNDLTAAETVILAQNYYHLNNLETTQINSLNDIKKEVSQNHLVVVPTAGRLLGNPNFRVPGPVYHMLVISGYNTNSFITQDVGTRNGQNYIYNQTILYNAIHDWTGNGDTIINGAKNMIIVN